MQKLRTIIVDDEPLALDFLRSCLAESNDIEIVEECRNGRDAVAAAARSSGCVITASGLR